MTIRTNQDALQGVNNNQHNLDQRPKGVDDASSLSNGVGLVL